MEKILIPLLDNELAPRFDLAADVLVVSLIRETSAMGRVEEMVTVLEDPSAEAMCRLAVKAGVQTVICAGIEKEFFDFLEWKGIRVLDDICGPVDVILEAYLGGRLATGQSYY
ncbi:dinitrogenase iron-molybdenum cofactor biosynthesis protein [Pseudodesulfovibrio cashew]|uniref:Dinitrogenase iron-molybdenum cofactor biosynthesis protein n=1 Tax=Pseudodesulfovibrio cashew TaxID=2678688 RepID=A0A6I6JHT0_9BACT|nr:dinitrogenase iron-molybdenum cofactor biosynthesis protein [Pseudodesulfovibrio cashew]QGY41741.1 dinitrogenase iron-molybdenum cofactor biosynthesis protein [Pseudodesulfovibrio cashew]